jgi:hypothetical protein
VIRIARPSLIETELGWPLEALPYRRPEPASLRLDRTERHAARRQVDTARDGQQIGSCRRRERLRRATLVEGVIVRQEVDAALGASDIDGRIGRVQGGGWSQCAGPAAVAKRGRRRRRPCHEPDRQGGKHGEQRAKAGRHRRAVWIGGGKRGKCCERASGFGNEIHSLAKVDSAA